MTVAPSPTEGAAEPTNAPDPSEEGNTSASAEPSDSDANPSPADSSTADGTPPEGGEGAKQPDTILGAVEKALESEKSDADSPPAEGKTKDQEGDKSDSESSDKDGGEDDDENLPFHEHPRWKQVVSERDDFKAKAEEYKPAHEAITRVETFLTDNNLTVEEFNQSLQISALMRNDPHKALEALTPYWNTLLQVTGHVLPKDLQEAVEAGTISENYAQEIAKARAGQRLSEQRVEVTEQRSAQQQQSTRHQALQSVASAWEQQWSGSDPDYQKKAPLVREKLELWWSQGKLPQSDVEMRSQLEEAKAAVEKTLRGFMPKKPATTPNPSAGTGGKAAASAPQPKSVLDVINNVVGA